MRVAVRGAASVAQRDRAGESGCGQRIHEFVRSGGRHQGIALCPASLAFKAGHGFDWQLWLLYNTEAKFSSFVSYKLLILQK